MENQTSKYFLLHYGELALKGGNRKRFEDKLVDNVRSRLDGAGIKSIRKLQGRILLEVENSASLDVLTEKLSKTFGLVAFAPTILAKPTLADIEEKVACEIRNRDFKTFAVRARRNEKRLPFTSQQVNEHIGGIVLDACKGVKVNLSNPETTIAIEIFEGQAFISLDKFAGPGGLPTGTGGRVSCLISGGIDSPVAAWRMMKRGLTVDFIHFHSDTFTDSASKEKVREVVEMLSSWMVGKPKLVMIPFAGVQRKIVTEVPEEFRVILYRRFMIRIAESVARKNGSHALVTGEAIGQVASQTLTNLVTIDSIATMPVLRPLIGMDKQEIVDMARKIGTYELSILPHNDCCQFLEPRKPATSSRPLQLENVEKVLDVEELIKEGLTGIETADICR